MFGSAIVHNDQFVVNDYTVTITMSTATDDHAHQNIAYERMKYWFDYVMYHAIMISSQDPKLTQWLATEQRILILPTEPVDQMVGYMLFKKLSAIVENKFVITDLEISSTAGDDMVYLHSGDELLLELPSLPIWWDESKPTWFETTKRRGTNKIVKLDRVPEWKEIDLGFDHGEDKKTNDSDSTVVKLNFIKDDKE